MQKYSSQIIRSGKCACLVQALRIDLTNLSERCGRVNQRFHTEHAISQNEVNVNSGDRRNTQFRPVSMWSSVKIAVTVVFMSAT